jgi:hypothetical protein
MEQRVLPEKQMFAQLLKKFPDLYGNRRFIIVFISHAKLVPGHHGKACREDEEGSLTRTESTSIRIE